MFDILIRNAQIIDGTGKAGYPGELAIADGRIAAIGEKIEGEAKQAFIDKASAMYADPSLGFPAGLFEKIQEIINP